VIWTHSTIVPWLQRLGLEAHDLIYVNGFLAIWIEAICTLDLGLDIVDGMYQNIPLSNIYIYIYQLGFNLDIIDSVRALYGRSWMGHMYQNKSLITWVKGTLQGGQKCCHIVLFSKGVHVWTSTMVILEHIFLNFLHNMVGYNTKNSIAKKIPFSNLYCAIPKCICGKKMYVTMY